jgi:hypothetical protein
MTKTFFDFFDIAVKKRDYQKDPALSERATFFRVFRAFRGCPSRPQAAHIRLHSRNSMIKPSLRLQSR